MDANIRGNYGAAFGTNFSEGAFLGVNDTFGDHNYIGISGAQPDFNANCCSAPFEKEYHEDFDFSDIMLKYITDMLMEEDMDEETCMFQDSAALQAAERSFYEVLGEKYPPSPDQPVVPNIEENFESNGENFFLDHNSGGSSDAVIDEYLFPNWDFGQTEAAEHVSVGLASESTSWSSCSSSSRSGTSADVTVNSPVSTLRIPEIFSDSQSIMQFQKGVQEASTFLPNANDLLANIRYDELLGQAQAEEAKDPPTMVEKRGHDHCPDKSMRKRNPHQEDGNLQGGKSNKQSAKYSEPTALGPAIFDMVLLSSEGESESALRESLQNRTSRNTPQSGSSKGSRGGKSRDKKRRGQRNAADLTTLLTLCANSIAVGDLRSSYEFLKQIREHSSPTGDGMQRLAHYFANGLEARLAGSGSEIYKALISLPTSGADALKAYHLYISVCPFRTITNFFSNETIMKVSEKATRLHIVDFGILYGFQWPSLIQRLSSRPGGPPKLRITGIDIPRPGFRPSARVEETGRRLANYAETFKVPFEFNAIAQKWVTIKMEDLKIEEGEVLVVNCLFRLRYLLDETVMVDSPSPRDIVLNRVRQIKPDVFIHGILNGSYSTPFFVARFREALFHFSSLFDMLEANVPREIHERLLIERAVFGRQAMNVIACEDAERIERPETYKQWQVRNVKAGFKPLPFDEEIVKMAKDRVKSSYHKDFVIDEDGHWLLQGWKGRTLYALSSWKPAY